MKHLPQKILAALLIILLFLVIFTSYIQQPIPTFKRLIGKDAIADIKNIKLERYDTKHHPVLFKITAKNGQDKKLFKKLTAKCNASKIQAVQVPEFINKVDKNLVKTIKKSQEIYATDPKKKKFYLLFTQDKYLFIYTNDIF